MPIACGSDARRLAVAAVAMLVVILPGAQAQSDDKGPGAWESLPSWGQSRESNVL
jgi:hypothetical protein